GSHAGRTYTLSGSAAPTYPQLADMLTELTGRPVRYRYLSDFDFATWMAAEGRPDWETAHAVAIFAFYRNGGGELGTDHAERITGHPPRPVEDFLAEHNTEFQSAVT